MEAFPEDVRQFLRSCISSVEQLEILRVMGEDRTREWSAREICEKAQVSAESCQAHLEALHEHGILRVERTASRIYFQFGPTTAELEQKVRRLLELYRQRPVTMIRMVYERPASSLRDFADAFRLRKKEE